MSDDSEVDALRGERSYGLRNAERRAREVAHRLLTTPPQPKIARKPNKEAKPKTARYDASKPERRGQADKAS